MFHPLFTFTSDDSQPAPSTGGGGTTRRRREVIPRSWFERGRIQAPPREPRDYSIEIARDDAEIIDVLSHVLGAVIHES